MIVHVPRQKHIFVTLGMFTLFSGVGMLICVSALKFALEFVMSFLCPLLNLGWIHCPFKDCI